jgi:threonine dehydratase
MGEWNEERMDEEAMLTLEKFEEASETVKRVTLETKLVYSEYFSARTGNKVYLKPENMQFTGAYKLRGAYYKISTLTDEERQKGLVTASAGNHAQGVAYAAKSYGTKAVIVMPTTTPLMKVNRTKSYGAEVVLYGDVYDEACEKAYELAAEHGYTFIHPFDDTTVATGQGTIAMEIFKELPLVDIILVPIGGGGLATGISVLAKLLNPKIKVIGVEPAGANCMQESIKAGKVLTLPNVNTIADGTAVKTPGEKIFPYLQQNLDDIITVEDEELVVAFLDMVENHKMIVENSGLLTVAALNHLDVKKKKIVSILSGGNMDVITMSSVVKQGLILRDRIFTVSVLLPDKPGELYRVSGVLAEENGNVVKLEHNQFVSTNRNAAVEIRITLEAFGTDHKKKIMNRLQQEGYRPKLVKTEGYRPKENTEPSDHTEQHENLVADSLEDDLS